MFALLGDQVFSRKTQHLDFNVGEEASTKKVKSVLTVSCRFHRWRAATQRRRLVEDAIVL